MFRTSFGEQIFNQKYAMYPGETWGQRALATVTDVCGRKDGPRLDGDWFDEAVRMVDRMEFIPGGRYVYYGGRDAHFWNNCFTLRLEHDTRECWSQLVSEAMACLMSGGGIGADYTEGRPKDSPLRRTGGTASGPIPLMEIVNEAGRRVMQGNTRRSAMLASLNWQHADFEEFLHVKDWDTQFVTKSLTVADAKRHNFDFPGRLDMTNISGNYDDHFLARVRRGQMPPAFRENVRQAMRTGEPGFLFNFGPHVRETLRNACGEVCSEDDADVCNLGSVNMSQVDSIERFRHVVQVGTAFLLLGSIHGELPLAQSYAVRDKNRRLGLGLMGVHEWLLRRGYRYEMVPELREWMRVYQDVSDETAATLADHFSVSRPKARRAIAPTGTIGILAGTTTGIETLFAVAYKRRFLKGKQWMAEFVVDGTAKLLIEEHGLDPDRIETSLDLAADVERRLAFQADMQDYVDQCISSTINLPSWASRTDPEGDVDKMAALLAKYAYRLRGATFYPDGARGGQPLTPISYAEATAVGSGARAEASDVCELTGKGGTCGA